MSENEKKIIEIPNTMTVRDLAEWIQASPIDVIKQLMANGVMANINQKIDFDTAAIVIEEFGYEARQAVALEEEKPEDQASLPRWRQLIEKVDPAKLETRPPVVTILGHVDHGKTTLLDAIRETDVAAGEVGGITQHVGAYQVRHNNRTITFLDTPGHAAFTAMRARGAQGADIAVLVVAADDGVMPQTREALAHVRAARVPLVVALNKIDRPNANPDHVKQQLSDLGLIPDDWDGDTMVVPVSAKERTGLEDLLEAILLIADSTRIQSNASGVVFGTVIEAELDKARGVVSTLLVQNGTLRVGDAIVVGTTSGRVRAMFDYQGAPLKEAPPSMPVSVMGLSEVPDAGELFEVAESEREARIIAAERKDADKAVQSDDGAVMSLEQIFAAYQEGKVQELRLVIKADVQGSLAPLTSSLDDLKVGDIQVNVLHAGTGNISESDVMLATASEAIVIGFNVEVDQAALRLADKEKIDIRVYNIIYRLTEDIEKALKGMLEPEERKVVVGQAEILEVFKIPKMGFIAGCRVVKGELRRNASIRVLRGGEELHDGPISSLKHEKDNVNEVREGFECGVGLKGFDKYKQGDILECYTIEKVYIE
ncbi:MAG: translation initiation factor IF-2 [Anaerolineales bacterium]|nr:translation initiation factor IF-2 [Anaerolineales bacterium]